MKLLGIKAFAIAIVALVAACSNDKWIYYNPKADPDEALKVAAQQAKEQDKMVLMVFGADWCPDCRKFSQALREPPLQQTVENEFVIVSVDVGQFDNNIDFAKRYGNPIKGGIPGFAVVSPDASLLYVNDVGEFATARKAGREVLNDWFGGIIAELNPRAVTDFDFE